MTVRDVEAIRTMITDLEERIEEACENLMTDPTDGFSQFVSGALTVCQLACETMRKACNRVIAEHGDAIARGK